MSNTKNQKDKKGKSEKFHIHTTISKHTKELIDTYSDMEDNDGNKIFGKKSKVIQRALELLDNYYNPKDDDVGVIWSRTREELNMVLVGKTTFLSYISGNRKKAYTDNIAVDVIEWYLGKRKEEMDLEEFLKGLKGMWYAANYFRKIDIIKYDEGAIQMTFNHDLTREYGKFWANYFKALLENNWNCSVQKSVRNESFHLIIKEE